MKRILAMLLLLAMTASLFSACAKEEKPSEKETEKNPAASETVTEEITEEVTEAPAETTAEPSAEASTEAPATEEKTEKEPATEAPETVEETTEEKELPLDRKDPVSNLLDAEKEDFYRYHVPQLNCETRDGKKINQEIDEFFGKEARQGIEYGEDGLNTGCYEIDYTQHWYGDVLVLVIWKQFNNDFREYRTYSVYCVTGNRMSNEGILRMLQIPQDQFLEGAAMGAEAYYRDYYPEATMGGEQYQEQLDWTLSAENINMDMMMFPGRDGTLKLISKIGSLAGASYYEQIYDFVQP